MIDMQCKVFNVTYNGAVNFDLKNPFVVITITISVHVFFKMLEVAQWLDLTHSGCPTPYFFFIRRSPNILYEGSQSFNSLKYFAVGFICSCILTSCV